MKTKLQINQPLELGRDYNMSEVATKEQLDPVVAAKVVAWGKMGKAVHEKEIELQLISSKAINDVVIPKDINDVPDAEKQLVELKRKQKDTEKQRKELTNPLDSLSKRLMLPEKSFDPKIDELSKAIISIKKSHEASQAAVQKAEQERKDLKERILALMNNKDFEFRAFINTRCADALTYALKENIDPKDIETKVDEWCLAYDVKNFTYPFTGFSAAYIKQDEVNATVNELFKPDGEKYVTLYREEMKKKFVDYAVAFANKEQAIAINETEQVEKVKELVENHNNTETSIAIESVSETLNVTVENAGIKALKKSYEVDMEESADNAILILSAFVANIKLTKPKLRITKWFSFSVSNAAMALSKCKTDDNDFNPHGITFKEISKL